MNSHRSLTEWIVQSQNCLTPMHLREGSPGALQGPLCKVCILASSSPKPNMNWHSHEVTTFPHCGNCSEPNSLTQVSGRGQFWFATGTIVQGLHLSQHLTKTKHASSRIPNPTLPQGSQKPVPHHAHMLHTMHHGGAPSQLSHPDKVLGCPTPTRSCGDPSTAA
jgi:hypothetical protein